MPNDWKQSKVPILNKKSIATKTTRSAAWLFGQGIITNFIGIITAAILARQLDPKDFGLVALASVLLKIFFAFGSATVGNYIIYDCKEGRESRVQAAFWLNLTMVFGICLVFVPFSSVLAKFYDQTLLQPVLLVILGRLILSQISIVPEALIKREIDYRLLVVRDSVLAFISAFLGVGMALTGWGVWSLIIPGVIITIPRAFLVMWMSHWHPNFKFGFQYWREIFAYVKSLIGTTLLQALGNDGDSLVIGKLLGNDALGIYDRAWRTSNLVTQNLTSVISDVAMPSLSKLRSHPEAMRQAYHRMLRLLGIIAFPLLIGLFVVADEFILLLYGPKWISAVLPLRVLIIFTLQRAIGSPVGTVYNSMGRPDIGFKLNIITLPFYFLAILLGASYGINGVAYGVTIIRTLSGFVAIYLACKLIQLSFMKVLKSLLPPLEISMIMAAAVFGVKLLVNNFANLPVPIELLIYVCVGGIVYFFLLLTIFTPQLEEILFTLDSFSNQLGNRVRHWLHRENQITEETV